MYVCGRGRSRYIYFVSNTAAYACNILSAIFSVWVIESYAMFSLFTGLALGIFISGTITLYQREGIRLLKIVRELTEERTKKIAMLERITMLSVRASVSYSLSLLIVGAYTIAVIANMKNFIAAQVNDSSNT